ncbi:hypothetical protein ACIPLC_36155 [Kitasatospora sp. NPDC086801]|uniref:hypothetical protein n=1 Tax=Kitasatospora sp. NPDC086801 TaxID=3364066 RepID=UPI0038234F34
MHPSTLRNIAVTCSTCEATDAMPTDLVDPEDEGATYRASCQWRRSLWHEQGWRWVRGRTSCPRCPALIVEVDGAHVAGPGL